MKDLQQYTGLIDSELTKIGLPNSPVRLYDPLRYFLQIGGKRIRPILTLLSAELFGASSEKALPQALCIEVFHNFTLIHDDIMDEAPLRRNQQTVHEKWNRDVAILSGDVLMIKAYQLLGDIDAKLLPPAFDLFNKTAIEVCEGQQMDMDFEERSDVSIDEYIEMIRLKTSVLLGCALEIGAIVAEASDKDRKEIYAFGQHIGIAFQIQDDILDLYADPDQFGKQVGGDVIANKKTILHLTAIKHATKEQLEVMKQLQNAQDLVFKVDRTRRLFNQLEVRSICESRMQEHYGIARASLAKINIDESKKESLIGLAAFLMNREV
ncbi:MAG: polyprenyl synthetase family protein [Crocinitomicaceae bacterium]|nr:polyprenyl synthetase family protein [Flavobacteriales bacterium]NQZ38308.1 polyprenyl synthetase family protein [Crocinitomicaceae bacterium]